MKRRLSVAIALVGDPLVCYLDEPSTGSHPHSSLVFFFRVLLAHGTCCPNDRALSLPLSLSLSPSLALSLSLSLSLSRGDKGKTISFKLVKRIRSCAEGGREGASIGQPSVRPDSEA